MEALNSLHSPLGLVRKKISQDRNRFQDYEYDLDLTYITNNLIAMGFPSSGIEKLWRNSIDEIGSFLKKYHDNHFMIWNLSGRSYNYEKFNNQILDYGFPDHHSPPLEMLFKIVLSIHSYLTQDSQNVAVLHCMGGKGRTGTVIACYLIYAGICKSTEESLEYFARRRSQIAKGVIQASQLRYTRYFGDVISKRVKPQNAVYNLKSFEMNPPPRLSKKINGCRPIIMVYSAHHFPKKLLYTTENLPEDQHKIFSINDRTVYFDIGCMVHSDVMIAVANYEGPKKKPKKKFRLSFHTGFIQNGILTCRAEDFDDAGAGKKVFKTFFDKNFQLKLTFEEMTEKTKSNDYPQEQISKEVSQALDTLVKKPSPMTNSFKKTPDEELSEAMRISMGLPRHQPVKVIEKGKRRTVIGMRKATGNDEDTKLDESRERKHSSVPRESPIENCLDQDKRISDLQLIEEGKITALENIQLSPTPHRGSVGSSTMIKPVLKEENYSSHHKAVKPEDLDDGFIDELYKVLEEMSGEQRKQMERIQLEQQQRVQALRKSRRREEDNPKIVIGKFGMM